MGKCALRKTVLVLTMGTALFLSGCGNGGEEAPSESGQTTTQEAVKEPETKSPEEYLKETAEELLHNTENVRGNLDLVVTAGEDDDVTVTWKSSDTSVITDAATGDNGEIPAGVVTRGDEDRKVTLTATLSYEGETLETTFDVTVVKRAEEKEYSAYVYTYFQGNVTGNGESQHIHMAVSSDGLFWSALNDDQPILKAELGTKGARDSYLVRSPEGDRFYLIATDLDANGGDWASYGGNGSRCIRVWESDDLINWSEERLVEIAPENATCMWAPETTYDTVTGEYVVYWASGLKDGTGKQIWYAKTRDFCHFSQPQVWKAVENGITYIDTTMTEYNGTFYRFTKNENELTILLETSDTVLGGYDLVKTRIAGESGVEGPAIYRINGEEKWILYMDGYAGENTGVGYFPLIAESEEDLKNANFRRLDTAEYEMPLGAKHGSFVPVTEEEYQALLDKWGREAYPEDNENAVGCILDYDMTLSADGTTVKDQSGQGNDGVISGTAKAENGALYFDGNTSVELPKGMFDGQNYLTINLWCKNETGAGNYSAMFFGAQSNPPASYWLLNPCNPEGLMKSVFTNSVNASAPWNSEAGISGGDTTHSITGPSTGTEWAMYTTVITPEYIAAYYNGEYLGKRSLTRTVGDFGEGLAAYIGKSSYPDINYKGYIRDVSVYDHVLSGEEVQELYSKEK